MKLAFRIFWFIAALLFVAGFAFAMMGCITVQVSPKPPVVVVTNVVNVAPAPVTVPQQSWNVPYYGDRMPTIPMGPSGPFYWSNQPPYLLLTNALVATNGFPVSW